MKKLIMVLSVILLTTVLIITGCAKPAPAPAPPAAPAPAPAPKPEPIKLKSVDFLALNQRGVIPHNMYLDKVNEMAKGELVIEMVGGPEAIPQREQPEAVRAGAVDMTFVPYAFYRTIVPTAAVMPINRLPQKDQLPGTPWYDFAVKVHAAGGLRFLGEASFEDPFHLYSTKPIKSPAELEGLRFRSTPAYPFFEKLGVTPITMEHAEMYSALERGLVDGVATKTDSIAEMHLYEVMGYIIGPGFWGRSNLSTILNLDVWNKLPKNLQDIMIQARIEVEPMKEAENQKYSGGNWQRLIDNGMEHIEWSPEDNQWFLDTIDEVMWARVEKAAGPDAVAKMKKLMGF